MGSDGLTDQWPDSDMDTRHDATMGESDNEDRLIDC